MVKTPVSMQRSVSTLLLSRVDLEGERTWKRILRVIEELWNEAPAGQLN